MKRILGAVLIAALLLAAAACGSPDEPATTAAETTAQSTRAAQTAHTLLRSTEVTTQVRHSPLYLPKYTADDVIRFFDEVVLSSEYATDEEPNCMLRWEGELCYYLHGSFTQADADWIAEIFQQLCEIDGIPGARRTEDPGEANVDMYFCDREEFHERMYDSVPDDNADGATTFYYNGANHITSATICYWEDMSKGVRRSVLTEEIINSIGFANDSTERRNSVVYQYGSWTETPDEVDWLLLRLIYAPQMRAGMRRAEAERVIRTLYY